MWFKTPQLQKRREGVELEEREQGPPLPEGNTPPPPKSGEVEGVPEVEAPRMAVEKAKGAKVVAEGANGAPQLEEGEGETQPPPPPLPKHQEERMPPPASQRQDQKRGGAQQQVKVPPKSGEVKGVPGVEEEVPKVVVEEAKVAGVVVAEVARVVAQAQPKFLTPSQPREPRGTKKGVETKQPQVLKRGSSAGRIAEMKPGEERDGKVVRLEDGGELTTWQGRKGRERKISSTSSEGGSSPARKRQSSPSSPRGSSKASRTIPGGGGGPTRSTQPLAPALDGAALDKNSNTPPAAGAGHQNGC